MNMGNPQPGWPQPAGAPGQMRPSGVAQAFAGGFAPPPVGAPAVAAHAMVPAPRVSHVSAPRVSGLSAPGMNVPQYPPQGGMPQAYGQVSPQPYGAPAYGQPNVMQGGHQQGIQMQHQQMQRAVPAGRMAPQQMSPAAQAMAPPAFAPPPAGGGFGEGIPSGTEVRVNGEQGATWIVQGLGGHMVYILNCSQNQRPQRQVPLYQLEIVPKHEGFFAVLEPLQNMKILVHLIGGYGMSVQDARSQIAPQLATQPQELIFHLQTPDGQMAPLQDHYELRVGHTVFVNTVAASFQKQGADTMTAEALEVSLPSDGIGCCAGLKRNFHCKAFWSSLMIWIPLIIAAVMSILGHKDPADGSWFGWMNEPQNGGLGGGDESLTGLAITLLVFFVIGYLFHQIESCLSSSCKYLSNVKTGEGAHKLVKKVKKSPPQLSWHIQCYHMETRTRVVTYTDNQGRSGTRIETYTVRVDTHSASKSYRYDSWDDVSGDLPPLEEYKLTKLTIGKKWIFADDMTEEDYYSKQERFIRINDRDVSYDFQVKYGLKHYLPKVLAEIVPGQTPCWLNRCCFTLWNLFCCSWAYRACFTAVSGARTFNIIKRIQKTVPIMTTFFMPTITVIQPFIQVAPPQQPGMVYAQPQIQVNVSGGANVTVNVN